MHFSAIKYPAFLLTGDHDYKKSAFCHEVSFSGEYPKILLVTMEIKNFYACGWDFIMFNIAWNWSGDWVQSLSSAKCITENISCLAYEEWLE